MVETKREEIPGGVMGRCQSSKRLISFKHIPIPRAVRDFQNGLAVAEASDLEFGPEIFRVLSRAELFQQALDLGKRQRLQERLVLLAFDERGG